MVGFCAVWRTCGNFEIFQLKVKVKVEKKQPNEMKSNSKCEIKKKQMKIRKTNEQNKHTGYYDLNLLFPAPRHLFCFAYSLCLLKCPY